MRPFSRSAKQASLFCSRLIKWLFLSVWRSMCANLHAHTTVATEAHGTPQQMRPTQPCGGLAAAWVYD